MSLIENLQWRHAVKAFDPNQSVSQENIDKIIEATRLAPTSSGLQPFKVIVVKNQAIKAQLVAGAFNPDCMKECSHMLVFAGWQDLSAEVEEAAASLGANRWQVFYKIIFPAIWPALITGFSLAFARAIGEYGSVIFIAGNMPMVSEITPLIIITKLEQYDYEGATAVAVVMLVISFALLFLINAFQWWSNRRLGNTV